MSWFLRVLVIAAGVIAVSLPISAPAVDSPGYAGIPDGFDYPADKNVLEQFRRSQDLSALRRHSWMLFAGMTQLTADGTPFWETWYRASEAFRPAGPTPQGPRRVIRQFATPRQFRRGGLTPQAPGESVMSFVLFNKETYDHIRTNKLYQASTLQSINASFSVSTPWDQRKIADFPARAMSLKTIWWPVAADKMTPLPVWDNDPARPIEQGNPYATWKRIVAIDGMRQRVPPAETTTIKFLGKDRLDARVVGLERFYKVPVTSQALQTITQAIQAGDSGLRISISSALGRSLKVGDYLIFLGFHVTSKEIDDWTWATFWWHDRPDDGPFAAERPSEVKDVWRNYLMTIADDQVTPREPDGFPRIGFNPWLEAGFPNGPVSNCMSCHHRASYPGGVSFLPVTRGLANTVSDPAFAKGRLRTDFLWSVVDRSN